MPLDPRYDDEAISDEDRLFRFYPHEQYGFAEGESAERLGAEELTRRLSTFGFQAIADARSGLLGMSVYVARLLPEPGGPESLLRWWIEKTGSLHSLAVIQAGALRRPGLGLGIRLDPVPEPFGDAHANVALPVEGGEKFKKSLRRRVRDAARVVLP